MDPRAIVVGAGNSGFAAARALAAAGARVTVYEARDTGRTGEVDGIEVVGGVVVDSIDVDGGALRVRRNAESRSESADHLVLATGTLPRPTPFPGWTLPGVVGLSSSPSSLAGALPPVRRVVLAGSGPALYALARTMIDAGRRPDTVLDTGPRGVPVENWRGFTGAVMSDPARIGRWLGVLRQLRRAGVVRLCGVEALRASGDDRVESVEYERYGETYRLVADRLVVADGDSPNVALARLAGCSLDWDETRRAWVPRLDEDGRASVAGVSIAGGAAGFIGSGAAAASGRIVGWAVARRLGLVDDARQTRECAADRRSLRRAAPVDRFLHRQYRPLEAFQSPDDDVVVCRCEGLTAGAIRESARGGCREVERLFRCPAPAECLGRACVNTVSQVLADQLELPVAAVGGAFAIAGTE